MENCEEYGTGPKRKFLYLYPEPHSLTYLRAYVKEETDLETVKAVCKRFFTGTPSLFMVSDICREAPLVELEGAVDIEMV